MIVNLGVYVLCNGSFLANTKPIQIFNKNLKIV
jgi:hypothetical protein